MSLAAQLVAAVLAALGLVATGWKLGIDHEKSKQADIAEARQQAKDDAASGAAEAIAKIEIKQQTIVQKVQHEVQTKTVYRDCIVPADGRGLLNAAIGSRDKPAGDNGVQAASSPD